MGWVSVEVPARRIVVPRRCVCCGVYVLDRSRALIIPSAGCDLRFSCCAHCLDHDGAWQPAHRYATAVIIAGFAATAIAITSVSVALTFAGFATICLFGYARIRRRLVRASMTRDCAFPGVSVRYVGDSCTSIELAFASRSYAAVFARANGRWRIEIDPHVRAVVVFSSKQPVANANRSELVESKTF
jgi:hypothetical protein